MNTVVHSLESHARRLFYSSIVGFYHSGGQHLPSNIGSVENFVKEFVSETKAVRDCLPAKSKKCIVPP